MKAIFYQVILIFLSTTSFAQNATDTVALRQSLDKATATLRAAFEAGDSKLVGRLHSPQVIKYFGGTNVIAGRDAVEKGAREWFENAKVEFVENTVESTTFAGNTAVQTQIFAFKTTPKNGGEPTFARGRSMVIYVQDKTSPTGWLSIREMAQEAPPKL